MIPTKNFPVNLQQGFITTESNNVIAAYSHHKKAIVALESMKGFDLPKQLKGYTVIYGLTDCFSLMCWTNNGDISIVDAILSEQK